MDYYATVNVCFSENDLPIVLASVENTFSRPVSSFFFSRHSFTFSSRNLSLCTLFWHLLSDIKTPKEKPQAFDKKDYRIPFDG